MNIVLIFIGNFLNLQSEKLIRRGILSIIVTVGQDTGK